MVAGRGEAEHGGVPKLMGVASVGTRLAVVVSGSVEE